MHFKTKKLNNNIRIIYGFKENEVIDYCMVTTLQKKTRTTIIHGLLNTNSMNLFEFIELWHYFQQTINTRYVQFEVIPRHARIYKLLIDIIESYKSTTFDGLECEVLKVNLNSKIRKLSKK